MGCLRLLHVITPLTTTIKHLFNEVCKSLITPLTTTTKHPQVEVAYHLANYYLFPLTNHAAGR